MPALDRSPRRELSLDEARTLIHARLLAQLSRTPRTEKLAYTEAGGRVLARPLFADRDLPPFSRSTRDGYALRSAELETALRNRGGRLRLAGEVRAGSDLATLPPEACMEIMTGAPLPAGADAVAMLESAAVEGEHVVFSRSARPGDNFVPAGQEARAGTLLLPAGRRLNAAAVSLLALTGGIEPEVYARPQIAVLPSGDELVDPAQTPAGTQIRNANSALLAARIAAAGGEPRLGPIAPDRPAALERHILEGLENADLLLLSGGASVGRYDLGRFLLEKLGAEFYFEAVRIRPGHPAVFGRARDKFFFNLPGNPVSTLVTFELLVRPVVAALAGEPPEMWLRPLALATLELDFSGPALPLVNFVPVRIVENSRTPRVAPIAYHGSGDLAAIAQADGFLQVPENCTRMAAGEIVALLPI